MSLEIKYAKKSCLAHEPKIATSGSAGFDLFAADLFIIIIFFLINNFFIFLLKNLNNYND